MHTFHFFQYFFCFGRVATLTIDDAIYETIIQNRIGRNILKLFHFTDDLFGPSYSVNIARFCQSVNLFEKGITTKPLFQIQQTGVTIFLISGNTQTHH